MLFASDAKIIADKIDDFRPYMQKDLNVISEKIYESAKRGEYMTEYDVSYEDKMFVELLGEELEYYGYVFKYTEKYTESKGIFYTVIIEWDDKDSPM